MRSYDRSGHLLHSTMNQTYLDKLTEILDTPHDVTSFYENFLAVSANMSGAQMGVAWRGTTPPFQPICQVQNQSAPVTKLSVTEKHHNDLLKRAVTSEKAFIDLPPRGGDPLMFGSIHRGTQTDIVEFVLPRGETEVRHREILDQLDSFCSIATQFKESSEGPASGSDSGRPTASAPQSNSFGYRPIFSRGPRQYRLQRNRLPSRKRNATRSGLRPR